MLQLLFSFSTWQLEHLSSSSNNSHKAFLHSSIPGTSFPRQKYLVETFPVFVTDGTKIVWEEIQMGVQEMYL
jgi:hypothetical protein